MGTDQASIKAAIKLARELQERACKLQTPQEKRQQAELDRMLQQPKDKVVMLQMTDQAFRSNTPWRAAEQLTHILDAQGVPRFFSPLDRALLRGFQTFGGYLPGVSVPMVKDKMKQETANVVLPADPEQLGIHLRARKAEGLRMNVNFLGEALLGEAEAEHRIKHYVQALQDPNVEVISVKISTVYSQISPMARDYTIRVLGDRMELLYRAALKSKYTRKDGEEVFKFVYLDMEEYRDMSLTAEVFMRTLGDEDLLALNAGIALQAYIPDSFATQRRITEWAQERVAAGGSPVSIRIVKGANLEMEKVEASIMGWPQAPFDNKIDSDANYKRMLDYAFTKERAQAARIGIASHNLFELAYALNLAQERGVEDLVHFEMLEGMANHQRRALLERTQSMLLYAPACRREDFVHAIGYLVRRLDENTGPDNFLRHAFRLKPDSPEWERLEEGFVESFNRILTLPGEPRRTQDRRLPPEQPPASGDVFINEPDTDWSLPHHAEWAQSIYFEWKQKKGNKAPFAPLVIDGEEVQDDRKTDNNRDPSRPDIVVARFAVANSLDIKRAVECAKADPDSWRTKPSGERRALLRAVAQKIRERRADLMGIALAEGGKTLLESDPEISEAVDFCEYYGRSAELLETYTDLSFEGRGVVAVISPWNFPVAIPCGGIAAALAAGNTVIVKPAPATVLCAYKICECFWDAGISKKTLQFVYGENATEGTALVTHDDVDPVIFTGGTETAAFLLRAKPKMRLLAETGGKNAIIVSAMSDRDLAIKHIVHSAFGNAGQKCSACSLLVLEGEVYDDPTFKAALIDAARSLHVGSAWKAQSKIGPVIRPPAKKLEGGLKELEEGESWALMPKKMLNNDQLWSPAIKWDVQPGSATHMTEYFGPVLGVMRAKNLEDAITLVNATGFGLTSGLQSLDDREQAIWKNAIFAGNLYINRGITGAIVSRQPFGGFGKSAFGPGIKAGGPNYLLPLMKVTEKGQPDLAEFIENTKVAALLDDLSLLELIGHETIHNLTIAARSYTLQMQEEFGGEHDRHQLVGQDNLRRYRPVPLLDVRVHAEDTTFEVLARICAAKLARCRVRVTARPGAHSELLRLMWELTELWAGRIEFLEESDEALVARMQQNQTDRIRYAGEDKVPDLVRNASAESGIYLAAEPVRLHGRIELLWYLREQSLSFDYHRYGNLGGREISQ